MKEIKIVNTKNINKNVNLTLTMIGRRFYVLEYKFNGKYFPLIVRHNFAEIKSKFDTLNTIEDIISYDKELKFKTPTEIIKGDTK